MHRLCLISIVTAIVATLLPAMLLLPACEAEDGSGDPQLEDTGPGVILPSVDEDAEDGPGCPLGEQCDDAGEGDEDEATDAGLPEGEDCSGGVACEEGLICYGGTCLPSLGEGGACRFPTECLEGLTCHNPIGTAGSGECKPPSKLGEPCALTWVCAEYLVCNQGINECIPPNSVAQGGKCAGEDVCAKGLECIQATCKAP